MNHIKGSTNQYNEMVNRTRDESQHNPADYPVVNRRTRRKAKRIIKK